MTYLMCDSKGRILPVVTFVLISYFFSGELVCARPQDSSLSVPPHSNDTKDIVAEKVEPINSSTSNDRYKSSLKQRQRETMFNYVKYVESNCLSKYLKNDLNRASNTLKTSLTQVYKKINQNNRKIAFYFKKIKTKIKEKNLHILNSLILKLELWSRFKEIKSNYDLMTNHLKLLMLILFLKLFAIFKSLKMQHCSNLKIRNYHKYKNQNKIFAKIEECEDLSDIAFYAERIAYTSFDSLATLKTSRCKNIVENLRRFYQKEVKNFRKVRTKRNIKNDRELSYLVTNRLTVAEKNDYLDNLYQEKLIRNFVRNSLPDLNNDYGGIILPAAVPEDDDNAAEKTVASVKSPYLVVENSNSLSGSKPNIYISSSVEITTPSSPNWNDLSTSDMYPVQLITAKPKPYKPTTIINSVHSQTVTESNILLSSNSYLSSSINWIPSYDQRPVSIQSNIHTHITTSTYRPPSSEGWSPGYPYEPVFVPPSEDKDPALHVPYEESSAPDLSANEPFFVEPIVVSSVDQLPTNYPIPMENSSMGHNPLTVLVGSRPPEIVLLEDVTFQQTITLEGEQETLNQAPGAVAEDPPMAAAAPAGVAAAPPVAAAPAASGGSNAAVLGTLLSAGAGPAAALVGGAASAAGGLATGLGAGGATGLGQGGEQGQASQGPGNALESEPEEESGEWYQELAESVMMVFSFQFLRQTLMALYSLVMPHVSFMMTSGFTMIAFLFPWLYPHIVVPMVSLVSSFTARLISE